MKIALDVMGGDYGPRELIEGALSAVDEVEADIALVGRADEIAEYIKRERGSIPSGMEIVGSTEVVEMGEPMARALRKSDSSIRVAVGMVKEGEAEAVVSMGHSGVFMALCMITLGKIEGVNRPALGALIPTLRGESLLVDVGANVDVGPEQLFQFGVMGTAFFEIYTGHSRVKTALLSNGEEEIKGNEATRKASAMFRSHLPGYVGYVEGKDLLLGNVDVVVCDGFVGNILLKMGEGFVELLPRYMELHMNRIAEQMGVRGGTAEVGRLVEVLERLLTERFDYREYGGALLLGVRGVCVLGHGRSRARAVKNAIVMADRFARSDLVEEIERKVAEYVGASG